MKQLRREGVALAYEEAGSGAPPLVLVHALGSDHTCFAAQFAYFGRRQRVVAVDLRGHGQSDKPSQAHTVALLADDLAWLCYELGLYRPVLLGRGLGGEVAWDLAARYPDLPGAVVLITATAALPVLGGGVPVLRVAFDGGEGSLPGEINALVDAFLLALVERAPP